MQKHRTVSDRLKPNCPSRSGSRCPKAHFDIYPLTAVKLRRTLSNNDHLMIRRAAQIHMTGGMSLKDYVKETLLSITAGVMEAQQASAAGPLIGRAPLDGLNKFSRDLQGNTVTHVEFDVATTVEMSDENRSSGSVKVVALGGFSSDERKIEKLGGVSRVAFSVPLAIPKPKGQEQADSAQQARDEAVMRSYEPQQVW